MKKQLFSLAFIIIGILVLYFRFKPDTASTKAVNDTTKVNLPASTDSLIAGKPNEALLVRDTLPGATITTGTISPDSIVNFAQTLLGTPYLYASTDPRQGFDCSGFITYVFNHYKIKVPRSSRDFGNVGTTIPLAESKKGDLILFTGTDSTEREIGHMGIILSNDAGGVKFIHSSSGKAHGVTISPLDKYYQGRFVKTIRVFNK
jgi:cell wall-associated NlpC family hydrolase